MGGLSQVWLGGVWSDFGNYSNTFKYMHVVVVEDVKKNTDHLYCFFWIWNLDRNSTYLGFSSWAWTMNNSRHLGTLDWNAYIEIVK